MRSWLLEKCTFGLSSIVALGVSSLAFADGGVNRHHQPDHAESNFEIEYFSAGDSKSSIGGDAQLATSGVLIEAEHETNNMVFTFGYEQWNYNWTNSESLPFASGTFRDPWSTFTTLQLGFAYEHEINDQWELNYYVEAESSYEKETSGSNEYELGVDFTYEASKAWIFTLNLNYEYLDSEGAAVGVDFGIEWNHDTKEGWSGEFEISTEFPETSLTYHFIEELSTTMFFNESGTNTIRLSDSSPVTGMQGGYLEDEYNSIGIQLNYELADEGYLSFSVQRNMNRQLSFTDSSGATDTTYKFDDSTEIAIMYSHTF
ncbi:MAG: hypothetical protein COB83_02875 [Gammaproteobacteria bacterium]|nr:MAG: hypothetical protein COB83_02875 [Gammaproteobacteria bacterium]